MKRQSAHACRAGRSDRHSLRARLGVAVLAGCLSPWRFRAGRRMGDVFNHMTLGIRAVPAADHPNRGRSSCSTIKELASNVQGAVQGGRRARRAQAGTAGAGAPSQRGRRAAARDARDRSPRRYGAAAPRVAKCASSYDWQRIAQKRASSLPLPTFREAMQNSWRLSAAPAATDRQSPAGSSRQRSKSQELPSCNRR